MIGKKIEKISFKLKLYANKKYSKGEILNYFSKYGIIKKFSININDNLNLEIIISIIYKDLTLVFWDNKLGNWVEIKNNYLKIINIKEKSIIKIFNLFSNFGNIKEIYKNKFNGNEFIINFNTVKGLILCEKNYSFKYFRKHYKMKRKPNFHYNKSNYFKLEILNKFQRYIINSPNINTPNKLLFFFNINGQIKLNRFSKLWVIKFPNFQIKFHIKEESKSSSFLVKFKNTKTAIQALMYFHNQKFKGQFIKVSFSHSNF